MQRRGAGHLGEARPGRRRAQAGCRGRGPERGDQLQSTAFCTATAGYITAIDRYGDVLTATAPTVGDVVTAGSDLDEPSADAVSAGQDVGDDPGGPRHRRGGPRAAEAKLAAAEAGRRGRDAGTLAEPEPEPVGHAPRRRASRACSRPSSSSPTPSRASPTQTPLAQAAEQFNAAAVALEMAWLQLFADAVPRRGPAGAGGRRRGRTTPRPCSRQLADAGYYHDDVDGIYGPATVAAVQALQKANGLAQTGTVDKATEQALQSELAAKGGAAAQEETVSTAALQQTLKLAGYWTGPVDGQWTDELTDALKAFQKDLGVKQTGTVDAATIAAFEKALAEAQAPPAPSPSGSSATPSPSS